MNRSLGKRLVTRKAPVAPQIRNLLRLPRPIPAVASSEDRGELLVAALADEYLELLDGGGVIDESLVGLLPLKPLTAIAMPALHRHQHVLARDAPDKFVAFDNRQRREVAGQEDRRGREQIGIGMQRLVDARHDVADRAPGHVVLVRHDLQAQTILLRQETD